MNAVFKNTVYGSVFSSQKVVDSNDGLFTIETNLDRLYYSSILKASNELKKSDSIIMNDIISTEIDLQNISWLIRYRHFYKMDFTELAKILIPGGNGLQLESLQNGTKDEDSGFSPMEILKKSYPELSTLNISNKHNFSSQAQLFEELLDETRKRKFTGILTGYPFTIGIILVYFFMSERELHFISSVLNGKNYRFPPEQIKELIR
ncbi:MAG TPA: hypothetical protein DCO79_02095 [Spirochaeta sp.]|nr:hypothetical protein [Spirochaeta sp.]